MKSVNLLNEVNSEVEDHVRTMYEERKLKHEHLINKVNNHTHA